MCSLRKRRINRAHILKVVKRLYNVGDTFRHNAVLRVVEHEMQLMTIIGVIQGEGKKSSERYKHQKSM